MHCPFCHNPESRVIDSRLTDDGNAIRRRRQCPDCGKRFTTIETATLTVRKRSGVIQAFSRDKVIAGVKKACQGRPISSDSLAQLAQRVEETLRASGCAQVDSSAVGKAILAPLRELDVIAYLRYASVYSGFDTLDDFESAIKEVRADLEKAERAQAQPEHAEANEQ